MRIIIPLEIDLDLWASENTQDGFAADPEQLVPPETLRKAAIAALQDCSAVVVETFADYVRDRTAQTIARAALKVPD